MVSLKKVLEISVCFSDIFYYIYKNVGEFYKYLIDMHRSHFVTISFLTLLLSLLLLCGDIESDPGPEGTPVSENIISILHSNIRSLRSKLNYISDIIDDFDIVFFTETHIDDNISYI